MKGLKGRTFIGATQLWCSVSWRVFVVAEAIAAHWDGNCPAPETAHEPLVELIDGWMDVSYPENSGFAAT